MVAGIPRVLLAVARWRPSKVATLGGRADDALPLYLAERLDELPIRWYHVPLFAGAQRPPRSAAPSFANAECRIPPGMPLDAPGRNEGQAH